MSLSRCSPDLYMSGDPTFRAPPGLQLCHSASAVGPAEPLQPFYYPGLDVDQCSENSQWQELWAASKSRAEISGMLMKLIGTEFSRQSTVASETDRNSAYSALRCDGAPEATADPIDIDDPAMPFDLQQATTLMVRNLPGDCTCETLLQEWPVDGTYDLIYLPRRSGGRATLGYAFVNFVSSAHAAAFFAKWRLRRLSQYPRGRSLNIVVAERQGFHANLQQVTGKRGAGSRSKYCEVVAVKNGRVVPWEALQLDM
mmetsp:Transcript_122104/g.352965  ORF Transcript_122104/g.352965 Transcript_122104/m.352965 type:complete len:256 (-) Transcript_122104:399-1166(-)